MTLSPLQLNRYFLTDLHFTVAPQFDPQKELDLANDDFVVEPGFLRLKEDGRDWQVTLKVTLQVRPNANTPYSCVVAIVGFFKVHESYNPPNMQRLVETNAPSILYSILREVVRDTTARGPYAALMLPPVSFYVPAPAEPGQPPPSSQ